LTERAIFEEGLRKILARVAFEVQPLRPEGA